MFISWTVGALCWALYFLRKKTHVTDGIVSQHDWYAYSFDVYSWPWYTLKSLSVMFSTFFPLIQETCLLSKFQFNKWKSRFTLKRVRKRVREWKRVGGDEQRGNYSSDLECNMKTWNHNQKICSQSYIWYEPIASTFLLNLFSGMNGNH